MAKIFSGLRVVDLTKVFSGPFATRMLADYGAEVIKIESESSRDDSRSFPPIKNNWSGYYEILNRNKKGLSLDLKQNKDLEKFYALIKSADVFVENLTPSVKKRLKIDYEILKKINPQLVYASLSGTGQDNDKKYYDVIAQAQSGLISLSGAPNLPMKIGPSVVDAFSGMTLAFAISSALFYREKTGVGQYLDVTMLGSAFNLLESNLIEYSLTRKNPTRSGNIDNAISPFGVYKTKDSHLVVAIGNDKLWRQFAQNLNIDLPEFSSNELRLKHNDQLTKAIELAFATHSTAEIENSLQEINIPCSKINEMSDVFEDQNNFSKKFLLHFNHSKLGDCVIPGSSINFSENDDLDIEEAP